MSSSIKSQKKKGGDTEILLLEPEEDRKALQTINGEVKKKWRKGIKD
jgi:hypothetical protein